ncbi:hypothetical protein PIECOFPK_02521 [Mycovorax composti]|jgi:Acyl-CoA-binding protein|uniref:ACB domain-containing protein n=2 Tax=Chitinophagaceae TaxID=563835 RepID=A0ABZ2EMJ4_9BACT
MSDQPTLEQLFHKAVAESTSSIKEKPDNQTLLKLYALYKQASIGDININPPSNPFDIVAMAKYNAWQELKGKSQEDAMREYIQLVEQLKG